MPPVLTLQLWTHYCALSEISDGSDSLKEYVNKQVDVNKHAGTTTPPSSQPYLEQGLG